MTHILLSANHYSEKGMLFVIIMPLIAQLTFNVIMSVASSSKKNHMGRTRRKVTKAEIGETMNSHRTRAREAQRRGSEELSVSSGTNETGLGLRDRWWQDAQPTDLEEGTCQALALLQLTQQRCSVDGEDTDNGDGDNTPAQLIFSACTPRWWPPHATPIRHLWWLLCRHHLGHAKGEMDG